MAVTLSLTELFNDALLKDTDVDENKVSQNLFVGRRLSKIHVDNTAGSNALCYLKLYDKPVNNVTVGTTDPYYVFEIPAAYNDTIEIRTWDADGNELGGFLFEDGYTYTCVTTGGTGGTSAPASAVIFEFWAGK